MTRAFWPQKKYIAKLLKAFRNGNADEDFKTIFSARQNDPVFNMAARFVRLHSSSVVLLRKILEGAFRDCNLHFNYEENLVGKPLMVLAKEPNMIRVYPNILLDKVTESEMTNVCWCMDWDTISTFYKTYLEEKGHHVKKEAWASTYRVWHKLKRFEELPITRVLSRIIIPKGLSENQLLQASVAFEEQRKPMKLTFCEEPKDYITMYASGPSSCMSNAHEKTQGWTQMFAEGIHPTSFYHYHPYIKGIYSEQRGAVVARTFIHQKENSKWVHGRIYASNNKLKDKFSQSLIASGYECMGNDNQERWWDKTKFSRGVEFDIPGVKIGSFFYCPMPYFDTVESSIFASFDGDTKKFHIVCGHKSPNVNTVSGQGFIRNDQLLNKTCSGCQQVRSPTTKMLASNDGKLFCTFKCAELIGYIGARNIENHLVYMPKANVFVDAVLRNTAYTTLEAAIRQGALPYVDYLDEEIDEEHVSVEGRIIRRGSVYFRLNSGIWEGLIRNGTLVEIPKERFEVTGDHMFSETATLSRATVSLITQRAVELDDSHVMYAA